MSCIRVMPADIHWGKRRGLLSIAIRGLQNSDSCKRVGREIGSELRRRREEYLFHAMRSSR